MERLEQCGQHDDTGDEVKPVLVVDRDSHLEDRYSFPSGSDDHGSRKEEPVSAVWRHASCHCPCVMKLELHTWGWSKIIAH
eukprot:52300-Amphidinium_carterae.1